MSRLCRLKSYKNIGEDGVWAYEEITKLRAELAEANQTIEEQIKVRHAWSLHCAFLDKELAEAKKDAERYRWLRERIDTKDISIFVQRDIDGDESISDDAEAAIDAAMRTTEESSVDGETK
jgi:multidrug resistance efflux pump